MIQDIPDDDWMLRDDVQWAYRAITDLGLTFDALGFSRHLKNFLTILKRYPEMRTVVDHCMKPQIGDHNERDFAFWADGMARIASETGAYCKLSGIVTESGTDWTAGQLRPYVEHVLSVFGPERVMWGSDWPVVRLRSEYEGWHRAVDEFTRSLGQDARDRVFGGTAAEFYDIEG